MRRCDAFRALGCSAFGLYSLFWKRHKRVAERVGRLYCNGHCNANGLEFVRQQPLPASPDSLPRLRYGSTYAFRLNAIDMAGYRLCSKDVPLNATTGQYEFSRFDPIPAPALLLVDRLRRGTSYGDQIDQMVLRFGLSLRTLLSQRYVVPPRTTFEMVERYGLFDVISPDKRGRFSDVEICPNGDFKSDEESGNPIGFPPTRKAKRCEYLPDPLAESFCSWLEDCTTPGRTIEIPKRSFYQGREWPNARRIMVRAIDGDQLSANWRKDIIPGWPEESARVDVLVITIPKSHEAVLHFSSGPTKGDCATHGCVQQLVSKFPHCCDCSLF